METKAIRSLRKKFSAMPLLAIEDCKRMLVNNDSCTFGTWVQNQKHNSNRSICLRQFHENDMIIICKTCGESCPFCMHCFNNSNHQNHDYYILPSTNLRYCQCGNDVSFNENCNFCADHGKKKDCYGKVLDSTWHDIIDNIVSAAIHSIIIFGPKRSNYVKEIATFLTNLVLISDSYRHSIGQAFSKSIEFYALLVNFSRYDVISAMAIRELFLLLLSDESFTFSFTQHYCNNFFSLISIDLNTIKSVYHTIERTSSQILLSLATYVWKYIDKNPELYAKLNIPDILSKYLCLITSLVLYDNDHPLIYFYNEHYFFPHIKELIGSSSLLTLLSQAEYSEILFSILESIASAGNIIESEDFHSAFWEMFDPIIELEMDSTPFFHVLALNVAKTTENENSLTNNDIFPSAVHECSLNPQGFRKKIHLYAPFNSLLIHAFSFQHFIRHATDGKAEWKQIEDNIQVFDEKNNTLVNLVTDLLRRTVIHSYFNLVGVIEDDAYVDDHSIVGRFSAIACLLSFSSNVNEAMRVIQFNFDIQGEYNDLKFFCFFYLIACIISDKTIFYKNDARIVRERLIYRLYDNPKKISELTGFRDRELLISLLDDIAIREYLDDGSTAYKLHDEYHVIKPSIFITPNMAWNYFQNHTFIDYNMKIYEPKNGFDLSSCLYTPCFYAACFMTVREHWLGHASDATLNIMLSIFQVITETNGFTEIASLRLFNEVKYPTIIELAHIFPSNFHQFLNTRINKKSMATLLKENKYGIKLVQIAKKSYSFKIAKPDKEEIIQKYKQRMMNYLPPTFTEEQHKKWLPIRIVPSIDGHHIMWSCGHQSDEKNSYCEECGLHYKFHLPILGEKIELPNSNQHISEAIDFIIEIGGINKVVDIIERNINQLEYRCRDNPFALDDIRMKIINGNLFRCAWIYTHKFYYSPNSSIISKLLATENPTMDFVQISKPYINDIKHHPSQPLKSLRDALLISLTCLWRKHTLSSAFFLESENTVLNCISYICRELGINNEIEKYQDKMDNFWFKLPPRFTIFADDNYRMPIVLDEEESEIVYSLIDQKCMLLHGSSYFYPLVKPSGKPQFFIILTGPKATNFIMYFSEEKRYKLPNLYVDCFGDEDEGLKKRRELYLSYDKLWKFTDELLSGELFMDTRF